MDCISKRPTGFSTLREEFPEPRETEFFDRFRRTMERQEAVTFSPGANETTPVVLGERDGRPNGVPLDGR